jgi:hypothetical protein
VIAITGREAAAGYDRANLKEDVMRKLTLITAGAILSLASLMTTAEARTFGAAATHSAVKMTMAGGGTVRATGIRAADKTIKIYCHVNRWGKFICSFGRRY